MARKEVGDADDEGRGGGRDDPEEQRKDDSQGLTTDNPKEKGLDC